MVFVEFWVTMFPKPQGNLSRIVVHSSRKKYIIFYANSLLIAKFQIQ
jgi:hypothetical protein